VLSRSSISSGMDGSRPPARRAASDQEIARWRGYTAVAGDSAPRGPGRADVDRWPGGISRSHGTIR
jgi:hypothetical protein